MGLSDLDELSQLFPRANIALASKVVREMGKEALYQDLKEMGILEKQVNMKKLIFDGDTEAFLEATAYDTRVLHIKKNLEELEAFDRPHNKPKLVTKPGNLPHYEAFLEYIEFFRSTEKENNHESTYYRQSRAF